MKLFLFTTGSTIVDEADCNNEQSTDIGQKVFQDALKEFAHSHSIQSSPFLTQKTNLVAGSQQSVAIPTSKNAIPKTHQKISRVMSENNMSGKLLNDNYQLTDQSGGFKRLFHKKSERTSDTTTNNIHKTIERARKNYGYSTSDLITFDNNKPLLSQKSYETLNRSQADLFRITAV